MEMTAKHYLAGGVVVVALVALVYSLTRVGGSADVPDKIRFVCVASGEFFSLARGEIGSIPAKNPKTGEATLLPCYKEEGSWYVDSVYRRAVEAFEETNRYVNADTLQINASR